MIRLGALLPHPPVMITGIGQPGDLEKVADTVKAVTEIDRLLAENPPETLVVFTPHGTVFQDAIVIYEEPTHTGNLGQFGLPRKWQWQNDLELVDQLVTLGQDAGLPVVALDQAALARYRARTEGLDHGVLVPLSFFDPEWAKRVKLVVIPLSYLPLEELYHFGTLIGEAATALNRHVAIIASGDLSHCVTPEAPVSYDPRGAEFDQRLIQLLQEQAVLEFFELDPVLLEKAAECGFRSLIMLLGAFDRVRFTTKVHSYQAPFGVGYGVASFMPQGTRESILDTLYQRRNETIRERRRQESPLVRYARRVVEAKVTGTAYPEPEGLEEFATESAGVFVSIKKHNQLRGCIGTTEPTTPYIVAEVKQNAVSAATRDPRFEPVETAELEELVYSVDVLKPAEPVFGLAELDPERYGVIVTRGHQKGLLLPKLEGIETAAEQVAIAKKKAGIGTDQEIQLERFEVIRYY